jgi:hypothetical protein
MKAVVVVHDHNSFMEWYNKQPSFYDTNVKGTDLEKKFAVNTNDNGDAAVAIK